MNLLGIYTVGVARGTLNLREWKTREWKSRHHNAGVENAGVEIAGKGKLWKANILTICC